MGGNLATDCGRKNMRLTPFSTALGMSDRNGHEKSHRRKPMARIRLICPYRSISSLEFGIMLRESSFKELNFPLFCVKI